MSSPWDLVVTRVDEMRCALSSINVQIAQLQNDVTKIQAEMTRSFRELRGSILWNSDSPPTATVVPPPLAYSGPPIMPVSTLPVQTTPFLPLAASAPTPASALALLPSTSALIPPSTSTARPLPADAGMAGYVAPAPPPPPRQQPGPTAPTPSVPLGAPVLVGSEADPADPEGYVEGPLPPDLSGSSSGTRPATSLLHEMVARNATCLPKKPEYQFTQAASSSEVCLRGDHGIIPPFDGWATRAKSKKNAQHYASGFALCCLYGVATYQEAVSLAEKGTPPKKTAVSAPIAPSTSTAPPTAPKVPAAPNPQPTPGPPPASPRKRAAAAASPPEEPPAPEATPHKRPREGEEPSPKEGRGEAGLVPPSGDFDALGRRMVAALGPPALARLEAIRALEESRPPSPP
ncbi:hypothetical protein PAPYR_3705 [Paratrimastix pyriformis]|uniref:Uncharacterized protein n=1 Tax=Paratrimastix pyriformis TaxID=342808 RepID=A0ABQ8UPB7_9EUKA|nr:hypothetical protein PAPYR_3705 [Paratrimastix pyriformis]